MISIPLSLAIGIALLNVTGFGLNQLSIAGFVMALGLLVDDSIVVVENIARYVRQGYDRAQAAVMATDQIALAVLGCTATLLFAFLPLLFLPGGARHVHPRVAGRGAVHDRGVAARGADDHPVPREPIAVEQAAGGRGQRGAARADRRNPSRLRSRVATRARMAANDTRWPPPSCSAARSGSCR